MQLKHPAKPRESLPGQDFSLPSYSMSPLPSAVSGQAKCKQVTLPWIHPYMHPSFLPSARPSIHPPICSLT